MKVPRREISALRVGIFILVPRDCVGNVALHLWEFKGEFLVSLGCKTEFEIKDFTSTVVDSWLRTPAGSETSRTLPTNTRE